jgi:S1-C subfamily serine protease
MRHVFLGISLVTVVGSPLSRSAAAQAAREGTVSITVALVDSEFQAKPLALFQLELWRVGDSVALVTFRTSLAGKASQSVKPGNYLLKSTNVARTQDASYAWSVPVTVRAMRTVEVELTNQNADRQVVQPQPSAERVVAPEIVIYQRARNAVIKVQAGLSTGTGFLIDSLGGVVITNEHVIDGQDNVSVITDSVTRFPAQVVAADHDRDLAILRFDVRTCPTCGRLAIAHPDSTGALVVPGQRVIAIGFPLHQQSIMTSGIVSGVRDRAIISDVNINHGNSGGPLLTTAGDVVAINTFMDASDLGGPGISGSITVTQLDTVFRRARDTVAQIPLPEGDRLPTEPLGSYPLSIVKGVADSADPDQYHDFTGHHLGNFELSVNTPVANLVLAEQADREMSSDRRKREARANLPESQRYSQFAWYHNWMEYVGSATTPMVLLEVVPRVGETFGSALARGLAAAGGSYSTHATYKFKGDLQSLHLYRNGVPVAPVYGGRTPQRAYVNDAWVTLKDVAYRGLFAYLPDVFAPDSTGRPPSVVIQLSDLKHPNDRDLFELDARLVARIWNDFEWYVKVSGQRFVAANPDLFQSDFPDLCFRFSC